LVVQYGLTNAGFVSVGEESANSRANCIGEVVGEEGGFEPFEVAACADPFFLEVDFRIVRQVAFGTDLQASERLSAKAGSVHQLLSFPGWSGLMARLDIGPFSFRIFWRLVHSCFQVQVILAVLMSAARALIARGVMFLIPISCW